MIDYALIFAGRSSRSAPPVVTQKIPSDEQLMGAITEPRNALQVLFDRY